MANIDRADRVKRFRPVPRKWDHGEVVAVEGGGIAWVVWDGKRKPQRVPLGDLRPEDDRTTTTGSIVRGYTPERPIDRSKLPQQMTQAAGRGLPQRTGGVSERYRRWVRTLPCAWCGAAPPSDANHEPRRGMSGGKRDDLNVMPLCSGVGGCHDTVTRTGRLGNMGPEDTKTWMRERIMDLLKAWIRAA